MAETKTKPRTYAQRLADSIASMPNPVKDTKAYSYKYETLDQVLGIVQPALNANGLTVMQGMYCMGESFCLRTYVLDGEDGLEHMLDLRPVAFGTDPQKNGSAETYARRYALKTAFGLCGEDDDGAAASAPRPAKAGKEPSKAKTAPQKAPDALAAAKKRMWAAMKEWGAQNGRTPEQVLEGVRKRPDWAETADFFNGVADEFEGAVA